MASKDLKITFSGDTKSYRQEVDKASVATKKFTGDASSAMGNLAGVFGVDLALYGANLTAFTGRFTLLLNGMKASMVGATVFQGAMKIIKLALISTGVGSVVVAFGTLIAYFTQTERGAEFVERAMAGLRAAFRVLIDHAAKFGEGLFMIFSGKFKEGWSTLKESLSGIGSEMKAETTQAWNLKQAYQDLEDRERALITVQKERARQISELREKAKEEGTSAEDKVKFLNQAMAIERQMAGADLDIAKQKLALLEQDVAMGEKRDEQEQQIQEAKGRILDIQTNLNDTIRTYQRELKAAHGQILDNTEALKKQRAEALGKRPGELDPVFRAEGKKEYSGPPLADVTTRMQVYADRAKSIQDDLAANTLDLSNTLNNAWGGAADGFGEFLGNMISGQTDLKDFGSFVAGQFAALAITVGKQMIAFGAAGIALKMLIKNPWTALAAGVALVALGTAAKNAISKSISGGGATASASAAGNGNYNYDSRQSMAPAKQNINITVGGKFELSGGTLVAAVSQENQRKTKST